VETIAISRDVPAIFTWFVNLLVRRVSRQSVANLLNATRRGLLNSDTGSSTIPSSLQFQRPSLAAFDEGFATAASVERRNFFS
jgi:hypothetical protein